VSAPARLPASRRTAPTLLLALLLAVPLLAAPPSRAADSAPAVSPVGLWQTISDVDGKPKAYVRIREQQGELSGTIEEIIDPAKRDKRCEKCDGPRHDQPVLGMTILTGLRREGDHYDGGKILDPDNGNVYTCKVTVSADGQHLVLRGYIGFSLFGRSQTWNRAP
jgi:uncharacterized protein (DUF2147 family)